MRSTNRPIFGALAGPGRGAFLNSTPLPDEQRAFIEAVERNWRLAPMSPRRDALTTLEQAEFEEIEEPDLSAAAIHSTGEIRRTYLKISFLNPHLDKTNPGFQEFMDASVSCASGLSQGLFTYRFISGRRPAQ